MRPIKFRAFIKGSMYTNHSVNLTLDGKISYLYGDGEWGDMSPEDANLMQFTGLLDKNKKEIYEDDILRVKNKIGVDGQWETDSYYRVYNLTYVGFCCAFIKTTSDEDSNQYPIHQTLSFASGNLTTDHRNDHYDRIAVADKYSSGRLENHYSNDIEVVGNIYQNPELLQIDAVKIPTS